MTELVCPECGESTFTQRRYAVIEYSVQVDNHGGEYDCGEAIVDGGDRDEPLRCDCGAEYHELSELVTEETYNESEAA